MLNYWYKSACLLVQKYLLTGTKVLIYWYKSACLLVQKYLLTGTKVLNYWYESACLLVQKYYKSTCPRRQSCPSHTRPCHLAGALASVIVLLYHSKASKLRIYGCLGRVVLALAACRRLLRQYLYFCTSKASKLSAEGSCFCLRTRARERREALDVSIRQHTSAHVSIRQHTSAYAYVSIRQHTSAYVSIRICQHTPAYVCIRQHTPAYVNIRADAHAGGSRQDGRVKCQYLYFF